MKNPGFVLYRDHLDAVLPHLTMEQRGRLLTALNEKSRDLRYVPAFDESDNALSMAFAIMANGIQAAAERYAAKCEQNRRNRVGKANNGSRSSTNDNDGQEQNQTEKEQRQIETESNTFPDDFERFWAAYPLHEDKLSAFASYQDRINAGDSAEDLQRAAQGYAARIHRDHIEPRFVKLAANFLERLDTADYPAKKETDNPYDAFFDDF